METHGLKRVFTRHDADGHVTISQYPDGDARSDAQRAKVMRSVTDPRQRSGENLRLYLSRLRVAAALMKP